MRQTNSFPLCDSSLCLRTSLDVVFLASHKLQICSCDACHVLFFLSFPLLLLNQHKESKQIMYGEGPEATQGYSIWQTCGSHSANRAGWAPELVLSERIWIVSSESLIAPPVHLLWVASSISVIVVEIPKATCKDMIVTSYAYIKWFHGLIAMDKSICSVLKT